MRESKACITLYIKGNNVDGGCGVPFTLRCLFRCLFYPEIRRTYKEQKDFIYSLEKSCTIITTSPVIIESLFRREKRGEIVLTVWYLTTEGVFSGAKALSKAFDEINSVFEEFRKEDAVALRTE